MKSKFDEKEFNKHGAWFLMNNFSENNWGLFLKMVDGEKCLSSYGKVGEYFSDLFFYHIFCGFDFKEFSNKFSTLDLKKFIDNAFKSGCICTSDDRHYVDMEVYKSPFFVWNKLCNEDKNYYYYINKCDYNEDYNDIFTEYHIFCDLFSMDDDNRYYFSEFTNLADSLKLSLCCSIIKCAMLIKAKNDDTRKEKFIKAFPELFKNKYFSMDLVEARLRGAKLKSLKELGIEF